MNLIQLLGNDNEPQALFSYPNDLTLEEAENAITECLQEAYERESDDDFQNYDEPSLLDAAENTLELRYNIRRIYLDEMSTDLL